MNINDDLCVGTDVGIASNGWAILDMESGSICGAGSRLFDAPETDKERKPKNQNLDPKQI